MCCHSDLLFYDLKYFKNTFVSVCGVKNPRSRIGGGMETKVNEYPWVVSFMDPGQSTPICTGTIIDEWWVLTSAFCEIKMDETVVVMGDHDTSTSDETNATVIYKAAEFIQHR